MRFLTSAASSGVMSFLVKGPGSKLIFYVVAIWVFSACMAAISNYLPQMIPQNFLGQFPSIFFYFMAITCLPQWLTMLFTVYVSRFAISLIPFVGPK